MVEIDKEKIIDAQNKAYVKAGNNAYFGNGFNAGVEFVLSLINSQDIHIQIFGIFNFKNNEVHSFFLNEKDAKESFEIENLDEETWFVDELSYV